MARVVEAGIALGQGERVAVIGRRENMLLWLPGIWAFYDPSEAARAFTTSGLS